MQKKDKEKVFGGDWSEQQLREFMQVDSHDGTDPDHLALIRAYRHMVPATFAQFVALFAAEGRNVQATDLQGRSAIEVMASHTQGAEYAEILKQAAGA
jgi:hypothetical protein